MSLGRSWFEIEVVSVPVPDDDVQAPRAPLIAEAGFYGPIVGEPVRFRFASQVTRTASAQPWLDDDAFLLLAAA
jgi:hypothetical protein